MFDLFNNSTTAIDIGSKYIKLVHGKRVKDGISIMNYGFCTTPEGSFEDGNIKDRAGILNALFDFIVEMKIKSKYAIIGTGGSDVILRRIDMPQMPEKQLKQAVRFEIGQYLTMAQDEYVIDSREISRVQTPEKKISNVLMAAIPRGKAKNYYYVASNLGMKVKAVDLFADSITSFFQHTDASIALLDMGYEYSTITIIESGNFLLEKKIPVGIKHMCEDQNELSPDIENGYVRQVVNDLIDGIVKVFDFYATTGIDKNISCIYLYGGGAKIKGIDRYMKYYVSTDVCFFSCEQLHMVYNIDEKLNEDIGLYINCISLLLRKE